VDPSLLLRPNPFSGDDGSLEPAMAEALALEDPGKRVEAIVAALHKGRVFAAVRPHAKTDEDQPGEGTAEAAAQQASDDVVPAPGGRQAVPVFTSMRALAAFAADARPLPVKAKDMAALTLTKTGILALDPRVGSASAECYIGRSAVAAIASGEEWTPPWHDPAVLERIKGAIAEERAAYGVRIRSTRKGVVQILVNVYSSSMRGEVARAVQTLVALIAHDPYLSARFDMVEIVPVRVV
jgi:hypothetical protein